MKKATRIPLELDPRRTFTPKQRAEILLATKGLCSLCGVKIRTGEKWIAGHVIPWNLGGRTVVKNGQAECEARCSKATHKKDTGIAAKTKRQAGEKGQYARRQRRGHGLIQNRGFSKTLKRKFSGEVVPRT